MPLGSVAGIAGRADVNNVHTVPGMQKSGPPTSQVTRLKSGRLVKSRLGIGLVGALTSQGYISHQANLVVSGMGISGTGVTIGVLSDSASAARIAALVASGDLPASVSVLPGQAGPPTGTDEGTAMMEIIHDLAPGANLIFATAFTSASSFANNIIALQQAGCKIIVDDVTY